MTLTQLARTSAVLNLLGSFLVFLSFQATSTDLLLVTSKNVGDKTAAFCVRDKALFGLTPTGGLSMGYACPQGESVKPTAVVNTDSPWMSNLGWLLLIIGFVLQVFSIEPSKLTAEDIRMLRKAHKLLSSN